jgi:hypothetical protein
MTDDQRQLLFGAAAVLIAVAIGMAFLFAVAATIPWW